MHVPSHCLLQTSGLAVSYLFYFFSDGRKLTCPSMPIISAIRKTDKANHRRVSGPQHILWQGKLLRHGMMYDTMTQPNMGITVNVYVLPSQEKPRYSHVDSCMSTW